MSGCQAPSSRCPKPVRRAPSRKSAASVAAAPRVWPFTRIASGNFFAANKSAVACRRRRIVAVREPQIQNRAGNFVRCRQRRLRRLDFVRQIFGDMADAQIRHVAFQNGSPDERGVRGFRPEQAGTGQPA